MKTPLRRHIRIALIAGSAISVTLFGLSFVFKPDQFPGFLAAQYPGWIVCAYLLPGSFESTGTASFIGIAVPTNAALYATIVFAAIRLSSRPLISWTKKRDVNPIRVHKTGSS